jgi:hypothetical protein
MARWLIVREEDRVDLFYENLITGLRYHLGAREAEMTDDAVVKWIFENGAPVPGERIHTTAGILIYGTAPPASA